MLARLEHTVEETGGTRMFCDTEPECQDCSNRSRAKLGRRLQDQKPARITADPLVTPSAGFDTGAQALYMDPRTAPQPRQILK
jgi:hypothetical protein